MRIADILHVSSAEEHTMAKYRGGVIGLGWMGLLYDLADRIPDRFNVDDVDRPTPELDIHGRQNTGRQNTGKQNTGRQNT